jgi:lipopolysaccharide assembly outer membrane protein LptD (OstA)
LIGIALGAPVAGAQQPTPPAGPTPPGDDERGPDVISVKAGTHGGDPKHGWWRENVDLTFGDLRIQADRMDIYEVARSDGSVGKRLVAEGNVVFLRGEERLAGKRLDMDLDTGRGTFEDAVGYVQPGVFVEGKRIERVDDDTYRVKGGKFTSCAQPNPRWSFTASSARIDVDDKIVATNVKFRVLSPPLLRKALPTTPLLYLPVLVYPIQEDQRSTGFLFPHFGKDDLRGWNVGGGFFWAIGRSADMTFYADHFSKTGYGFGNEFRYVRNAPSRGTFRTYLFRKKEGGRDYDVTWNALQMLPGGFRANLDVRLSSTQTFRQTYYETLDLATNRSQTASFNVQRYFGPTMFQIMGRRSETFFVRTGEEVTERSRIQVHLPMLRVAQSPKKLGKTGIVFSYEARAERLGSGDNDRIDEYERYDLAPEVSRPFGTSFLQITPRAQFRYTRYGATQDLETNLIEGPALERPYFESDLELRGPRFFRIFKDGQGAPRLKHEIGPEFVWRYRTRVDPEDYERIPKFDERDTLIGTNQVEYALFQRFLVKRRGPSGKSVPQELLSWRVSQTYYLKINDGENLFDPNYPSSSFGLGGTPDHNSPVFSRVNFRPTQRAATRFDLEYDVNYKQVRSLNLSANLSGGWGNLQAGWTRFYRENRQSTALDRSGDTVRGNGTFQLMRGVKLDGAGTYDILRKKLLQTTGRLRFEVQCCGFMVEVIEQRYFEPINRIVRFSVELANIGSFGNFMGQEADRARGAFR